MNPPTGDVDWVAVERRSRWQQWLLPPALTLFAAAFVVLWGGRVGVLRGPVGWSVVLVIAVASLLIVPIARHGPDRRRRSTEAVWIQHAMHAHVDPGPDLRERADQQARRLEPIGWMGLVYPLLPLSFLHAAPWDRPARAIPAFVVLELIFLGLAVMTVRLARDARRWLADPPGPVRAVPPALRRTACARWVIVLGAALLVIGYLISLVGWLLD